MGILRKVSGIILIVGGFMFMAGSVHLYSIKVSTGYVNILSFTECLLGLVVGWLMNICGRMDIGDD